MSANVGVLKRGYATVRQCGRRMVKRSDFLDRHLGDWLRRLEGRSGLVDRLTCRHDGVLSCHGLQFHYRAQDKGVASIILLNGDYEPETREYLQSVLRPGMLVLDIGSNIGYFALLAARAVRPTGRVVAFEPAPGTFAVLSRNVEANGMAGTVRIENLAVSDRPGTVMFEEDADEAVSSKITEDAAHAVQVSATSVDSYMRDEPQAVDLVKIDAEGAELDIFRGMRETACRSPRMRTVFELNARHLSEKGLQAKDFFNELRRQGFSRFTVLHRRLWTLALPVDLPALTKLNTRLNLNILAEKGAE